MSKISDAYKVPPSSEDESIKMLAIIGAWSLSEDVNAVERWSEAVDNASQELVDIATKIDKGERGS